MLHLPGKEIILASGSSTRQQMLKDAGLDFRVETAPVDEESLREIGLAEGVSVLDMATTLAEAKAVRVSFNNPAALVIGSDQILECEGAWFGKPDSRAAAAATLRQLAGKTHRLVTAAVVFRDGQRIWHHAESPAISMRQLTDKDIDSYLATIADAMLATPGVYQIERYGAQILSRIDGCPYAVLGLPLLQLLALLREHGLTDGAVS